MQIAFAPSFEHAISGFDEAAVVPAQHSDARALVDPGLAQTTGDGVRPRLDLGERQAPKFVADSVAVGGARSVRGVTNGGSRTPPAQRSQSSERAVGPIGSDDPGADQYPRAERDVAEARAQAGHRP